MLKAVILVLCFTNLRYTNGLEDLIGIPVEYDNSLFDNYDLLSRNWDTVNNDNDIWNEGNKNDEKEENDETQQTALLKKLCDNYDLSVGDRIIDCAALKLEQKALKIQSHDMHKRDVEEAETLEDGSGLGESSESEEDSDVAPPPDTPLAADNITETESGLQAEDISELPQVGPSPVPETVEEKAEVADDEQPKVTEVQPAATEEQPVPILTTSENPIPELSPLLPVDVQGPAKEGEKEGQESETDKVNRENEPKEPSAKEEQSDKRTGKKLGATPNDLAEDLNDQQSGAAVDVHLKNVEDAAAEKETEPNAKTRSASIGGSASIGEEPKSGESATEAEKGRKDTKILIALFAAVLAVGTAAFAYNYIRKRRRSNTPRTENGVTKSDPEEGREMKPLMKPAEPKPAVEYNDEKVVNEKAGEKQEEKA